MGGYSLTIEPASLDDLDGILEVERACFRSVWTREQYEYDLAYNPAAHHFVARLGGRIVGNAAMYVVGDEAHIATLGVLPHHRRTGIGTALLQYLLAQARRRGVTRIHLEVRASNRVAQYLYHKHGFRSVGRRRNYYTNPVEDAVVMVWEEEEDRQRRRWSRWWKVVRFGLRRFSAVIGRGTSVLSSRLSGGVTMKAMRLFLLLGVAVLLGLASCRLGVKEEPPPSVAAVASERPARRERVRPPAVAGAFYPASPTLLREQVEKFLAQAEEIAVPGELVGLIVPHAGYDFSGAVAGYAYRQLPGRHFSTVILLGPSHYYPLLGAALPEADYFETPLGRVRIDRSLTERLVAAGIRVERLAHLREHSLEVQLPFLQGTLKDFDLLPLVLGEMTSPLRTQLAEALAKVAEGRRVLFIASSDMAHYPRYEDAVKCDRATLAAIETGDPEKVLANEREWVDKGIPQLGCTLCGLEPVVVTLMVMRRLGVSGVKVLKYANSGDVPVIGDKMRVVGYGAVALYRPTSKRGAEGESQGTEQGKEKPASQPLAGGEQREEIIHSPAEPSPRTLATEPLSSEEQAALLRLARQSLEAHVCRKPLPPVQVEFPRLRQRRGAFVTLKKHGELRGCIGHIWPVKPLYQTVIEMAEAAALYDYRFPPVKPEELEDLTIEISVLSPLRPISDLREIEVGKHGIYLTYGRFSGLLLPQVATEQGWDREEFLAHTCLKAGLPPDMWRRGAKIQVFTAQVFGER